MAKQLSGVSCKVGWFESSKYADGTPVAYVAAIQELGYAAGGIPPRPTMRPTAAAEQGTWGKIIADGARKVVAGTFTPFDALDRVGLVAAGDIRKAISQVTAPALAPSTLAARRAAGNNSTKPLVDERILINTLTHQTEQS